MAIAAAEALAKAGAEAAMAEGWFLPTMDQWEVAADIAAATAAAASAEGLARAPRSQEQERADALRLIATARRATQLLMDGGAIAAMPEPDLSVCRPETPAPLARPRAISE